MRNEQLLDKLCCPETRIALVCNDGYLVTVDHNKRYPITYSGIPLFAESLCSVDAQRQKAHYEKIAEIYVQNLGYPHTQEYMAYLDRVFLEIAVEADLSEAAEICCGQGELLSLVGEKIGTGIGVDISPSMLEIAQEKHCQYRNFQFIQGDATLLPIKAHSMRSVFMFGGIHHVPDRQALFSEIFRILAPGGKFYFREPVSDFFLWRLLRAFIYRFSPALDADTERPLIWNETVPILEAVGFELQSWNTYGFIGFCLFMNSDVLVFNRFFRFMPGIRKITRWLADFDDWIVRLPAFGRIGLQVVGVAKKPQNEIK